MKIALGQMRVVLGQCENNFNTIASMIAQAKKQEADFIVFPEMCISGYCLQDKWTDNNFLDTCISYNEKIRELSKGIGVVFGNVACNKDEKGNDGRFVRYNAAYFCQDGKWIHSESGRPYYSKHLLPNYRVFDDERYFKSAINTTYDECRPFIVEVNGKKVKVGIEICEDLWSKDYHFNVTEHYLKQGVDIIFNCSSSPWTQGKENSRDNQIQYHVNQHDSFVPYVYVNACGMQNTGKTICVFDGNSKIYNKEGKQIGGCNDAFIEECKVVDINEYEEVTKTPYKLLQALTTAIQEVDKQMFNQSVKWIIGLSGGLDSTINACLLTHALGAKRVIGYNMASKYNSDTTKNNAKDMAKALGIEIREGSIEKIVDASIAVMGDYGYEDADKGLTLENIQARVRGHMLSTFAALENGVVINNGNKVETALGYCTMYGDSIGVFSPIGDCTKVELFELGHALNEVFKQTVVPLNLLPQIQNGKISWDMPPSAELKDGQLDPMKWFYHDWLISKIIEYPGWKTEEIMQSYADGTLQQGEMKEWISYYGLDDPKCFIDDLEWVLNTMQKAVFKRIQLPPSVMVSKGAFGSDFREVQGKFQVSEKYIELRNKILKEGQS